MRQRKGADTRERECIDQDLDARLQEVADGGKPAEQGTVDHEGTDQVPRETEHRHPAEAGAQHRRDQPQVENKKAQILHQPAPQLAAPECARTREEMPETQQGDGKGQRNAEQGQGIVQRMHPERGNDVLATEEAPEQNPEDHRRGAAEHHQACLRPASLQPEADADQHRALPHVAEHVAEQQGHDEDQHRRRIRLVRARHAQGARKQLERAHPGRIVEDLRRTLAGRRLGQAQQGAGTSALEGRPEPLPAQIVGPTRDPDQMVAGTLQTPDMSGKPGQPGDLAERVAEIVFVEQGIQLGLEIDDTRGEKLAPHTDPGERIARIAFEPGRPFDDPPLGRLHQMLDRVEPIARAQNHGAVFLTPGDPARDDPVRQLRAGVPRQDRAEGSENRPAARHRAEVERTVDDLANHLRQPLQAGQLLLAGLEDVDQRIGLAPPRTDPRQRALQDRLGRLDQHLAPQPSALPIAPVARLQRLVGPDAFGEMRERRIPADPIADLDLDRPGARELGHRAHGFAPWAQHLEPARGGRTQHQKPEGSVSKTARLSKAARSRSRSKKTIPRYAKSATG